MYQVRDIKLAEISTSALNPRKTFDQTEIEELAQSIKENGLIQAITLRKVKGKDGIKYEVVCGERRYRACKFLEMETVQAVVKELDDKQAFACMVIENLQRKDIDPLEEAAAILYLHKESNVPVKEITKLIGKSQSFVVNRIQLNNIAPEFVTLMREGTLNLSHLQEIAKLTKAQQATLLESCFKPAQIERWSFRSFSVETLKDWIDEHVMCHISTAKFDPTDETYTACKACASCKYNTASRTALYPDESTPRCMKMELFKAKNQEAILRQAKALGHPVVYVGNPEENKEIIQAAQELHLFPQPLGKREYLVEPTPPTDNCDPSDVRYQKRLANYERVKAVFDENLEAGIVIKVFEICYSGVLTGEVKYLFNTQSEEVGKVDESVAVNAERLSMYKTELRAVEESKQADRIERQRTFIESSDYASNQDGCSETEDSIFLALLTSRLPQEFRKTVGINDDSVIDITTAFATLNKHRNAIIREFIRMSLSDKSVGYSSAFSKMLDMVLQRTYPEDYNEIDSKLATDYEQKCKDYKARIAELEAQIKSKVATENDEEASAVDNSKADDAVA